MSFAHLARGSRASDDRPEDDDSGKGKRGKRASEDDDDEQQDREDGNSKSGKRASTDDDEDEDEEDDQRDSGKGKRSKRASEDDDDERADEDDDDEEEMRGNSAAARARRRERARCAAIFASKGAGRNPVLACKLAFNSSMPRSEAIEVLDSAPAPEGSRGRRQNPNLGIDGDRSMSSEQSIAASWDVAFQKAGAKRRR
ncbi:hypothetical protein CEJ98_09150 [Burkholderia gladioli pv. gladioli]|uniref:hypothetical protein n=1 Tax=Burkholderia gladioli TaxID=28095 RepID=UPI000694E529|nr:hypothetical protein [Burkholderia gladioli]ASD79160.1 hypothetical protein CEJ98_09150 [Burkholderia gladioli pv. gladioli]AWY55599.1 hypothetical protein A8H28_32010 [Burkholderia gladioli pv. gladioli]